MLSAQLSARDIPCSSNQRDTCQSPSMLCFVSAHTMRMCGHSTVLPCFHGCALPVHVVQAPRTSVQFGAQCCSTVCLITCPCSPLLASTNHSFGSPGIRLRVDDHSVEMRSRGCCFEPPARTSVQFSAPSCSTVSRITFQCSRLLASTNHSFRSPGTPLHVADHSVEMRSRGAGFKPPFLLAPVPRLSFSTFGRVYQCPGLFHGQIRSHGPQWQPPGLDQPLCRVKR
jgi:hypothetical protein